MNYILRHHMEYYFVLSFRENHSDGSGYHLHVIPVIESDKNCIFECYGAYVYKNGKRDIFSFSYEISCIESLIQQMKMLFNMWKSHMVIELHQMKLHKHEYLDFHKIQSKFDKKDQLWNYDFHDMKNKTCRKLLLSIVNV